jgi:DNA-binding NarL/FixJ family response regulator
VRITLAEDNVLLLEGLSLLLSTAGHRVTAVSTVPEFLAAIERRPPDVAVVDVRLPPTFRDEGLRAALDARHRHPGLPVLVLSHYVERAYATELLADDPGAVGYLLKDRVSRVDDFLDDLDRVAAGGTALDPEVVAQLVAGPASDPLASLTPRERQVLSLMAQGRSNATIAADLHVTERTVSKHITNIFAKLHLLDTGDGNRRVLAVLRYLAT